jgi:hypothetical protein
MGEFRELEFTCPICQEVKAINVPEAVLNQKKFGTIKIQVPAGAVCSEHQFIAFVDTKGIVRGYEKIDVSMSIQKEQTTEVLEKQITLNGLIQKYGPYGTFCLLHVSIFDYPGYIIRNKDTKVNLEGIHNFFSSLIPPKYENTNKIDDIVFDSNVYKAEGWYFEKVKLKEKDAFIMDTKQYILQTPWEGELKLEERFVKKALEIIDPEEQELLLKQDIGNFIKICEATKEILEDVKEIYENDLIDKLSKEYNISKIDKDVLNQVKTFLARRYSAKMAKRIKNKVQEFLDFL